MNKEYCDLLELETNDFQRREGNYPKSGVPDSIEVYLDPKGNPEVSASFKNTDEETGKAYLKKYLKQRGFKVIDMDSTQDGDYHNDWIKCFACIKLS